MEGATAGAAMTMATLLSTITEVFTASIGWVGTVAETVASNPLLLALCWALSVLVSPCSAVSSGCSFTLWGEGARKHSARPSPRACTAQRISILHIRFPKGGFEDAHSKASVFLSPAVLVPVRSGSRPFVCGVCLL